MAVTAAVSGSGSPFAHAFRALRHRDFRLFFIGQGISLTGTWMQQVAMSWLVYRLTGSAFTLGAIAFASQFPTFLLAPIAGVGADRYRRHRIVVTTQTLALVLTGRGPVWSMIALSAVLGIRNAFDTPARQSLFVQLVDGPDALANAVAPNSSLFNMARLTGPAVAGVLIGVVGEGPVFAI